MAIYSFYWYDELYGLFVLPLFAKAGLLADVAETVELLFYNLATGCILTCWMRSVLHNSINKSY